MFRMIHLYLFEIHKRKNRDWLVDSIMLRLDKVFQGIVRGISPFLPKLSMVSRKKRLAGRLNAQKAPHVRAKNENLQKMEVMKNFMIHHILLTRSSVGS